MELVLSVFAEGTMVIVSSRNKALIQAVAVGASAEFFMSRIRTIAGVDGFILSSNIFVEFAIGKGR